MLRSATLEPVIENQGPKVLSSVPLRSRSATIATPAKRLPAIVSRSTGYQPFGCCSPVPKTTTPIAAKSLFAIVTSSAKVPGAMAMPSSRPLPGPRTDTRRSEEHTSELQSLMRISYAVFCLNKNTQPQSPHTLLTHTQFNAPDHPITIVCTSISLTD